MNSEARIVNRPITSMKDKLEAVWSVYEALKDLPHGDRHQVIQLAQSQIDREAGQRQHGDLHVVG